MKTPQHVVAILIEELRAFFVEGKPLGGRVPLIQHRPGADVALDGLFEDGCPGIVWVNVLSLFRSSEFPVPMQVSACGGLPCAVIQVGAARCVAALDDAGYAPTPAAMERDALVGLDDAWRLQAAVCRGMRRAQADDVVSASVVSPVEPVGPEGGALAWVMSITVEQA